MSNVYCQRVLFVIKIKLNSDLTQQFQLYKAILIAVDRQSEQKMEWEKDIRPKNYYIPSIQNSFTSIKMNTIRFQPLQLCVYLCAKVFSLVYSIKSKSERFGKEYGISFPFLASRLFLTFSIHISFDPIQFYFSENSKVFFNVIFQFLTLII